MTVSVRVALLALGCLLSAGHAVKAAPADCWGVPDLAKTEVALGWVAPGSGRVPFLKNATEDAACPAPGAACRSSAFLVPGDEVVLGEATGPYICAVYRGRTGAARAGWLPAAAVSREPAGPAVSLADWRGDWTREEAGIDITDGQRPGTLAVKGDATWGGNDAGRRARGAINTGSIEGVGTPANGRIDFPAPGAEFGSAGGPDCRVSLRRLGRFLVVSDNFQCGGANVSFAGVYARESK